MDKHIKKQTARIQKQEQKILAKKESKLISSASEKLDQVIPEGLKAKLRTAFYQGFKAVFSKGTAAIEKTYNKDQLKKIHQTENFAFHNDLKKRALKHMDQSARTGMLATLGFSSVEGTVLGLFGIGLPDIPIFIGTLLKGIYEISLKYGYSYESDHEKYFILQLIEAALAKENKDILNQAADLTAKQIDNHLMPPIDLDLQMQKTADALAMDLLYIKFIQGIPLIGVIGGASNAVYFHKITRYAQLKYKKRYLTDKTRNEH